MTDFDELAQVLIIDMSVISIINTCANSSNSVISITTKSSMFLVYYQYYHFFHWNLNISFFITLKILMNSDSDL